MSGLDPVVQNATSVVTPQPDELLRWLECAAERFDASGEVTIRIVDETESQDLNCRFRGREAPTNVLSFGVEPLPGFVDEQPRILGDIVICGPVVIREAEQQGKSELAHWAHMVVHGVLHLVGYDHEAGDREAEEMETLESNILAGLGFPDPYHSG